MKIIALLICFLFALAAANISPANIKLEVFSGSNDWWIAVGINDASVDTQSVQIQQASSSTWESMSLVDGLGFYAYTSDKAVLSFPISIRLNSVDGHQVVLPKVISSVSVGTVDTGVQYTSGTSIEASATKSPLEARSSKNKHTAAPTTKASHHTSAPTTKAHTSAPTTKHTSAPTTKASHTSAPTTKASHTSAPSTTKAATTKPTSAPSSGSSGGLGLMVPLYTDPSSSTWNEVVASAGVAPTIAIINPDNGPGSGITSSYTSGCTKLHNAGVEIVGYVHSSYGARAIADVKADIDIYASQFPLLSGIFVDEVSASASEVAYYTELYTYIMSFPGWKYDIINPGAVPTSGYENAATQIVTYEDTASGFASSENPSWASSSNKNMFAMITYGGTSSSMQSAISAAKSKGYYGWVYVTDTGANGATYNSLPSFYAAEASYVASLN